MQPARRDDGPDPYAWLRHSSTDVTAHLAAERANYDARALDSSAVLAELRAHTPSAERSVSWDHGPYAYYRVTLPGHELPELRRTRDGSDETLLDMASFGSPYAAAGVIEPSPDNRLLAYSIDLTGAEVYRLRFRDMATGEDLPHEVAETYYSGAWSGTTFFYTVPDHLNRPHEIWRIDVETGERHLVLTEPDQRFELVVERSRSGEFIVITAQSRNTTEAWAIPADDPSAMPTSLRGRTPGVEYRAEHDADRWLFITNDGYPEFAVVGDGLTIANADERIHDVLAFTDCLVTEQRVDGECRIRVLERDGRLRFEIGPDEPGGSIRLGHNESSEAPFVTVVTESFSTPTTWWDVDLRTGERTLRHRRDVPGHDPEAYASEVVYATADDGWRIPVVFAKAHIRGGGEVSRQQWIDGHLLAKRNTFTDFIAAADHLADGLVDGGRIVSRGLSAGGLLMGAVYFMAPERWAGVIAEVPFVDCVNSMLDTEIPLTVTEWEEWGDPRIPEQRAYMESYTPYVNLPDPDARPALLVTGAVHDPRVLVHEPAKWVAALRHSDPRRGHRDTTTERGSVTFRVELGEGSHGGQAGRFAALSYDAEVIAWTLAVMGVQ